jgi:hypothetical protein
VSVPDAAAATWTSVRVERTGGLAGIAIGAEHDIGSLTALQRVALTGLAARAGQPTAPTPGADRFSYHVCLRHADGTVQSFPVPETGLPECLTSLVRAAS